jgi:hypothetical protein
MNAYSRIKDRVRNERIRKGEKGCSENKEIKVYLKKHTKMEKI